MSDLAALLVGTVLAVAALAFVLYPLFTDTVAAAPQRHEVTPPGDDSAIVALREIEFDRATGKLSQADYLELRKAYGERALQELRTASDTPPHDPIEARVRAYRATHRECAACGLRPEADAVYCSNCGAYLPGTCPGCRAPIAEPSAAFCSACGQVLGPAPVALSLV